MGTVLPYWAKVTLLTLVIIMAIDGLAHPDGFSRYLACRVFGGIGLLRCFG